MRTRLLLLCACIVTSLYCIAQPANNPCSGAVTINQLDGTCLTGNDNTGADEDIGPGACSGGFNDNVWFRFTAQGPSAEITINSGIPNPIITVWQFSMGPCNVAGALEIDCASGNVLMLDNQLTIGTTYYVMVAFQNNAEGIFDICIDNPVPASNDNCITATNINTLDGTCINYNNNFPSTDVLIPSCFTGSTYNVWFSFTAVGVSLDVNIPAGGPGPAQFAVIDFTGANCNSTGAVELGCATGTNHIVLDNQLTIGTQYHIVVGFNNSDFDGTGIGNFELCVDNPIPAPNDNCSGAINIPVNVLNDPNTCFTSIAGNPLDNDFPSTDVGLFPCWNAGDSYNIWYSFVAQGPDVEILVDPVFNADAQIALVQFNGTPCQLAGAVALDCAVGTIIDFNDGLVIGQTYYIAVGFEDNEVGDFCMNVFNPKPPPNDLPCNAEVLNTNGNCVNGTTVYANPELWAVPGACLSAIANTVWYRVGPMLDPDNVGYEIDLDFDNTPPGMQVSVILWELPDCNNPGEIINFYCGSPPTAPIEFGPLDETKIYYISVGTSEPQETGLEICVDEIPPCFTNDICTQATVINGVQSDQAFVCLEDQCNMFADPESFNNACSVGNFSTVWYQVPTDGSATLMNIQVTSTDFAAPTISLFLAVNGCNTLQPVGLTQSNLPCVVGSNGEAEALGTTVGASSIYYIAVSSLNSVGGDFQICVNTISQASACVTSRAIQITSRSFGGPLTGPFYPGETVGVCMNVNSYTAAGNGCQWFQGLVPVFGNGWDPSSFDANGQPNGATINGNPIGVNGNGVYGASTWDWFDNVGYHHPNVFFQIGDIDGNGTVDMCNILYDPDCPNFGGITGGCCGPCWDNAGDILPPGWFAYGINGTCPTPGPPISVDWGDGNTCGGGMGPWNFCFELQVRDFPDCLDDNTTMDLSLGFFTFADGEVGSWVGGASVCALDQPAKVTLPMCCTELAQENEELDPICSGQQFVYTIDRPDVDFWQWTVESSTVTGGTSGQGGPGTLVINTLTNNGSDPDIVTYNFLGFAGGACPVMELEVTIEVFPQIQVELDPLVLCATPTTPYVITPDVSGGSGNYEYTWAPGGENTPSITVPNPVNGTHYIITVTDDVGCFKTAEMTISVYSTFPVDIVGPVTEQCLSDGVIELDGSAMGGTEPYQFLWTFPDQSTKNTESVSSDLSGEFHLVVTDSEGCIGKDSVDLLFNESPEVFVDALNGMIALCEGQSTQLTGVASAGETPYYYEWDTPEGPESGKTIMAFYPGTYEVTVTDNNGCTATADIAIEEQPSPEPELVGESPVCNFDNDVTISLTEDYEDYEWSTGPGDSGEEIIDVYQAGTYSVTVTNEYGCTGETAITIEQYPEPDFPLPDTFDICSGTSITINADDYNGPWANFIWYQCGSCGDEFTTSTPGTYSVAVFDDNGCSNVAEFTITESASLNPDLQGATVVCTGSTVTITALPGFQTYEWSANAGGATGNSITVSEPGVYSVSVTDGEGCGGMDSHEVVSGDFTPSINGPASICANVQATLDAGPGYTNYLWSTGQTTQTIQVEEGTHSVTVTSTDGCTASASITIVEAPFQPVITGDDMICQTSEVSVLDAGGPYTSYQWSANTGGATTQTVTVSTAGFYDVTITDLSGCVGVASFNVGNHPIPFVAITGNPDFCVGGQTQMDATPGFTYLWNTNEMTSGIVINTPGDYTVTVTDANGCTNTATTTVNPPYQETVEITGSFVFCPGDQATLEVPSGYVSVQWSTGETTDQIMTSVEGTISVTVIDADGCIATDDVMTDENATLSPVITGDAAICDNGAATLNAGSGFDNYVWSANAGGATSQMVTVNAPGTYSVTVSSNSGCMGTDDFEVTGQTSPVINVTPTASACNIQEPGGPTTVVDLTSLVTGAAGTWAQTSGPSSVNISNPAAVDFNGLSAGSYVFTYTTNTAVAPCTNVSGSVTVTVTECACPFIDLGISNDLCNDGGSLDLTTLIVAPTQPGGSWDITNVTPPVSNPATITGNIFNAVNADAGVYTISYTLSGLPSYCPSSTTTTVSVLRTPNAGSAAAPTSYCEGESQIVALSSMISGFDPGGTWVETSQNSSSGGAFNASAGTFNVQNQAPGTYTFDYVVAGAGPCPDDVVTVEVVIDANPVADAGSTATLDCTTPSTTLGGPLTSVGPNFTCTWTTIDGTLSDANECNPSATSGGTYVLTVMNTLTGCSATDEVTISQNGNFPTDVILLVISPDCEGDAPGSAQVQSVVGGTAPYTYSLNGAPDVAVGNFTNLQAGDYDLEVTDASGCVVTKSFTIEQFVTVDLEIVNYVNDTLIYDFGDTIKLSYLFAGSSSVPDSVVWKFGDSILCINCDILEIVADQAGQISLEAWDVRGCKIKKTISFLVVRNRDFYIPNVFSPNGDGINDYFTVFTHNDITITKMEIFTRWGDLVYRNSNMLPNSNVGAWDGFFKGERLNPGVYVYRIEILHGDGLPESVGGDITIVR